ncbi:MAG: HEAT repeat domain-containing protein [Smithellaceae bacterium]|nr:HEAT repeat domain-containing protein [Smithellaceae bacterium]
MEKNILKLIGYLADGSDSKRRSAAEALSGADERAIYPLIKALRDVNAGVQDAAMRSLISIGGPTTAYMVLPLLREDAFLRNTALMILKEIGPEVIPLLRPLLTDKDDDVRKFAIDLIIDIRQCDYPDDLIAVLTADKNANVRASAAKALGAFAYRKAIPQLIKALDDVEWVVFSALDALSSIKDEQTISPIAALLDSPSDILRYTAIETLGKMGLPAAGGTLLENLSKAQGMDKTASVKSLLQLGLMPSIPGVAELMLDMYINGEWEDRLIVLKGLIAIRQHSAIPTIVDIAGSLDPSMPNEMDILAVIKEKLTGFDCTDSLIGMLNDPAVRYRAKTIAIEIIKEQNCKLAVPHLVKLFEGNLRDVKRASIQTLKEINGMNSEQLFLDALEDADGHVRRTAVAALGKIGDSSVVKPLLQLLDNETYIDVIEEAVKTLLTIDPQEVLSHLSEFDGMIKELIAKHTRDVDVLDKLIREDELNVKLSALTSLGLIEDERSHKLLLEALNDKNAEVRKSALLALCERGCGIEEITPLLNDADVWVRIYAIRALGQLQRPEAIQSIEPMLSAAEIPLVLSAIDAIAQIASPNNIDISGVLTPLLNHKTSVIRQRAQEVTGISC